MPNGLYAKGKEALLNGDVDWLVDDIRYVLVDAADYAVNLSTHASLADIPSVARVATGSALTSKTSNGGVADAADVSLSAVSGDQSEALVIYKHTGTESTSTLLAYIDTAGGLPATPNGGPITVTWHASGIFAL